MEYLGEVVFSLPSSHLHGSFDTIPLKGKIFEAGSYPDKQFDLTEEEMAQAVAEFQPVPLDIEHITTPFDGKLGELASVSQEGSTLFGEVRVPRWLKDVLGDEPIKVSTTWDAATKTIKKLALTHNPRINDAALVAAFNKSKHTTAHGQNAIQFIHDYAASHGALCQPPTDAKMTAKPERQALQKIHDIAQENGAGCNAPISVLYSEEGSMETMDAPKGFMAELKAAMDRWFSREENVENPSPTTDTVEVEKIPKVDLYTLGLEAAQFADKIISEARALPAQRDSIIALFNVARRSDLESGEVKFGESVVGSRVKELEGFFSAVTPHTYFRSVVQDHQGEEVLMNDTDAKVDTSRVNALLQLTPLGQAILKENK
jgi:hypothetical protein